MKKAPFEISDETWDEVKNLYWAGWTVRQLSDAFAIPYGTIDSRKRRQKWNDASNLEKTHACINARYRALILKATKTPHEIQEMEVLGKQIERMARVAKYEKTEKESDLNPNIKKRNQGKNRKKNALDDDMIVKLLDAFYDLLFDYQKTWLEAKKHRTRNILKSRQIGATFYFALEAFVDALETGDNQIFLSASKAQAHIFRAYIVAWVFEITGVELKGDPMVLPNGATLYFLSTSSRTAQGYHGNVYMDECFWIPKFAELQKVASGMAMQKKYRKTYFSTPSTLNHEAYTFWNGKHFNKGRPRNEHIEIDVSHEALKNGSVGPDGQWRQMVNIVDALENGCDLFDLEQLRLEYSPEDFEHLLMCQFVDDASSVFRYDALARCGVDMITSWTDFKIHEARPFGDHPVWIGYDPSRSRDDASLVVIAPPSSRCSKYRVLERFSWNNIDFEAQAKKIKELTTRYNVEKIAIDASGIGQGVYELVQKFYRNAIKITYTLEVKSRLVLQAMQIINRRSIEWDAGAKEIVSAFLTIKKTITPSGGHTTFKASRTEATGHADLAWAIMHAFEGEGMAAIDGDDTDLAKSTMEIF